MVFKQFKATFVKTAEKFNNFWKLGKKKISVSEEIKNKLLKIAYDIIEILEDVEEEVEDTQEEIKDILEEEATTE